MYDTRQRCPLDDERHLLTILLVFFGLFVCFNQIVYRVVFPHLDNLRFWGDEVAAASNILSSFQFVAGEHAYFDVSAKHISDGLGDLVLQAILDGSSTNQQHVLFHLTYQLGFQLLVLFAEVAHGFVKALIGVQVDKLETYQQGS